MAYTTLFLKDLTELKTRRGSPTNGVLARVMGLDFPTTEAEVLYEWMDLSTATGDDYLIVHPTTGSTLPGRWFKRKIEELDPSVPNHVKAILTSDIANWNQKQDPVIAGDGLTKTVNTLSVDNAEVVRSNRTITINGTTQNLSANRIWNVGDLLSTGSYSNPSWITSLAPSKITGLANVATSGSYTDLINKPNIPTTTSDLVNNSNFIVGNGLTTEYIKGDGSKATFPSIPASQIQSDWNQTNNSSLDFIKNKPTIPSNTNQLTNGSGFITASSTDTLTNKSGNISQWTNNVGYITTETDPTVPSYSKSLTAFSVIKSSTDPLYKAIGYTPTSGEITTALGLTPINTAGARTSISLTTTGTSGVATYNNSTGVLNIPNYTYTPVARVFNTAVSRTLNSNFTISTTRDSNVRYSINLSVTNPLLAGASTASAFLEYSTNGGTTWITESQVVNSSSVGVAVAIAITQPNTFELSGNIPANALVRLRTTTSGTASASYVSGSEMYY